MHTNNTDYCTHTHTQVEFPLYRPALRRP